MGDGPAPALRLRPAADSRASPSEHELREFWDRHEAARRERERAGSGAVRSRGSARRRRRVARGGTDQRDADLPLDAGLSLGPHARNSLRPVPRRGRVIATGVDTWSPCWYAEPGSPLARAMRALATHRTHLAWLLPEPVGGYRVGWFAEPGLVFAEGRPGGEALCAAVELPLAAGSPATRLGDLGVPLASLPCAGLRRLDVAADLWTDSAAEGLAFLECVSAASLGPGKLAAYRAERCVESILIKTRAGRTLARVYDKGAQGGRAPRGRWLRLEAQWRFPREARIEPAALDAALLRERFKRRFEALWQAARAASASVAWRLSPSASRRRSPRASFRPRAPARWLVTCCCASAGCSPGRQPHRL